MVWPNHIVITMVLSRKRCIQAANEMRKKYCKNIHKSRANNIKNILTTEKITFALWDRATEQEFEQGTAIGDIATGDLPSDLPSSGPVLRDPPSGPVLSDPPSGPVLSDPPSGPVLSDPPSGPVLSGPPSDLLCPVVLFSAIPPVIFPLVVLLLAIPLLIVLPFLLMIISSLLVG